MFAKTKDHQGHNALHCLLGGNGYVDVAAVQCLTAHNVGVDDLTDDGDCPLSMYFTSSKHWLDRSSHKAEIVNHLFRAGADPSFKTANGCLNFGHLAAFADEVGVKLLKVLAENGVNLAAEDYDGRTMLHHCALHGSIEEEDTLSFLCDEVGLSNDSYDRSGMTPLALATQKKLEVHHPHLFRSRRWIQTENILSSNLSDHRKNT
ncbi:uncharacterized protein RCC_11094 [Ramularia collo-cygni]|uniref:Uncharacterized protein n=1 Tax=Ramularia collo-cygni TaxID=112498 RepID=A0A2D3VBA2_9PEZI|nr:uncharacterized protein RCC_11094 [Ramularia collo-cygni]CZT25363.1 uncharacterized protein RCC_11094 [Ramularia collo-cygni]